MAKSDLLAKSVLTMVDVVVVDVVVVVVVVVLVLLEILKVSIYLGKAYAALSM